MAVRIMPRVHRLLSLLLLAIAVPLYGAELPTEKELVNSLGMKLVRIEAGQFVMGTGERPPVTRKEWDERDYDEAPAHSVTVSRPFYLGVYEVTNTQFEKFDRDHKAMRGKNGGPKGDDEPVAYVSWQQAVEFC